MKTVRCIIDYTPDAIAGNYWVKIGTNLGTAPIIVADQFENLDAALDWIREVYPLELARWREEQNLDSR